MRQAVQDRAGVAFARPAIADGEIAEVLSTLQSGWLTTGPRVERFEQAFGKWTGAAHAIALNSCTAGLHLSLLAAGIGPGDEVITTPLTFCATANVIVHSGARPVFADIDRDTMNLDPAAVEQAITPRTRAIIPVHYAGRPADMRAFRRIAAARGLRLIEDAAHAAEAVSNAGRVGTTAAFTCFSFYATKNLTTGEGGMVTTNSDEDASWIRTAALHGMSRDGWARYSRTGSPHYDVVMAGFKYNMMDLQAAIGLQQLARIEQLFERRAAIWRRYDEALADLPLVRPAPPAPGERHARHLYTILIEPERCGRTRDDVQRALQQAGIGTSIHFKALHLHPFYAERYGFARGEFPVAEAISDTTLSLPLSAALTDGEGEAVIEAVRRAIAG
jgi:dTDP-4-amino-4,6-dideoxygalactose transaminase